MIRSSPRYNSRMRFARSRLLLSLLAYSGRTAAPAHASLDGAPVPAVLDVRQA